MSCHVMSCHVTIAIEIVSLDLRWKRSNKLGSVSFRFVSFRAVFLLRLNMSSSVQFSSVRFGEWDLLTW